MACLLDDLRTSHDFKPSSKGLAAFGKRYRALSNNPVYDALARGLNFVWFAFTLFWFWADWKQIGKTFSALTVGDWLGVLACAWLFATVVLASWEWLRAVLLSIKTSQGPILISRYARVMYATALGMAALS